MPRGRKYISEKSMKYRVGDIVGNAQLLEGGFRDEWRNWRWMWKCLRCEAINGPSAISAIRGSEGCKHCKRTLSGASNPLWTGYEEISGERLWDYRYGAEKRGYEWAVTPKDLWDVWLFQDGKCAYTGIQLIQGIDASLDRIDNDRGYVIDNIQWVHKDINRMKGIFDDTYFMDLCGSVAAQR